MTDYNLEEFKAWLETNETYKRDLNWELALTQWNFDNLLIKSFAEWELPQGASYYHFNWLTPYQKVVQEWKAKMNQKNWNNVVTLQEYLDQKYPTKADKEQVKEISIGGYYDTWDDTICKEKANQLEGGILNLISYLNLKELVINGFYLKTKLTSLNLSNCPLLTRLDVANNQLSTLDLSHCQQLKTLWCANNLLTQITYPVNLQYIIELDIINNNLPTSDLAVFSGMKNLERLEIGNTSQERINQNIYNLWVGSLTPLQSLINLEFLDISNTNLDSGLEYLPVSLQSFRCSANLKPDAKCQFLYNCFANEQGQVETEWKNGPIKNFPQKLEEHKQKVKKRACQLQTEIINLEQQSIN